MTRRTGLALPPARQRRDRCAFAGTSRWLVKLPVLVETAPLLRAQRCGLLGRCSRGGRRPPGVVKRRGETGVGRGRRAFEEFGEAAATLRGRHGVRLVGRLVLGRGLRESAVGTEHGARHCR